MKEQIEERKKRTSARNDRETEREREKDRRYLVCLRKSYE